MSQTPNFSKKWFQETTKVYYELTRSENVGYEEIFYNLFKLPYKLVFKDATYDSSKDMLLESYYKNEEIIKKIFVKNKIKGKDVTSFYELKLNNSRIDIVSVNGKSIAYEIKTKYDNLLRLNKQINDYLTCFEYCFVICDSKKEDEAIECVPECVGIYSYDDASKKIRFKLIREAKKSPLLNKESILKTFTKAYLKKYFNNTNIIEIETQFNLEKINHYFKLMIKDKYKDKNILL